eukprot:891241-Pelagomonas_calceolata.AAC.2
MRGSYDGQQRECLGGQCSSSVGIVGGGQLGGHFLLSDQGPFLEGSMDVSWQGPQKESLLFLQAYLFSSIALQARSPCSSDVKPVGAGVMASCRPASLAL